MAAAPIDAGGHSPPARVPRGRCSTTSICSSRRRRRWRRSSRGSACPPIGCRSPTTASSRLDGAASRAGAQAGPLRIGFVGTLVWHKGVHVLIEAAGAFAAGPSKSDIHGDTNVFPDYVGGPRAAAAAGSRFDSGRVRSRARAPTIYRRPRRARRAVALAGELAAGHSRSVHAPACRSLRRTHRRHARTRARRGRTACCTMPFSAERCGGAPATHRRSARLAMHSRRARAPPVKSIAEDAREWEARYQRVCRARGLRLLCRS